MTFLAEEIAKGLAAGGAGLGAADELALDGVVDGLAGLAGLVCGDDAAEDVAAQIVVPMQAEDGGRGIVEQQDGGEGGPGGIALRLF